MDIENGRQNCRQSIYESSWKKKFRWRSGAEPGNLKRKKEKKLYFKCLKRGFSKDGIKIVNLYIMGLNHSIDIEHGRGERIPALRKPMNMSISSKFCSLAEPSVFG